MSDNKTQQRSAAKSVHMFPRSHTIEKFLNHRIQCSRTRGDCFSFEFSFREVLNEFLETAEAIKDAGACFLVLRAGTGLVDAECSQIFLEEVPIGMEQTTHPVLNIQKLRHVLAEGT